MLITTRKDDEMTQPLRVLAALPQDPSSVPSTHLMHPWPSIQSYSSSDRSDTLFWPLWTDTHTLCESLSVCLSVSSESKLQGAPYGGQGGGKCTRWEGQREIRTQVL